MITLITGLPGNGKTLYALSWLKAKAEKEGRPVYYSGITDCLIPGWTECEPERWMELPKGAIILIDEVQRIMRPRQHGMKVPEFVAELETHRHRGVDLVLITQHPMLLDSNVRRLTGQHFHVMRKAGTHFAVIHEWAACKEQCMVNRDDSHKQTWAFPTDVFALYKSAEMHTHKRRIPRRVILLAVLPLVLIGIAVALWYRVSGAGKAAPPTATASQPATATTPAAFVRTSAPAKATATEFLADYRPRVQGLHYTAPAYDQITKPVVAPYPAACVVMRGACKCFSQQGTKLETPDYLCRSIVDGGFFVAWQQPQTPPAPEQRQEPPKSADSAPNGGAGIIGYTKAPTIPAETVLDRDPTQPGGRGKNLSPATQPQNAPT